MTPVEELFAGGGRTGELLARLDWAATPLGPVAGWPRSLRAAVPLVLSSRYPMLLLWGEHFTQIYNDGYSALIGDKHPDALGADVRVTLAEGWDVLGPILDEVLATGVASWVPALRLLLARAGYREEAYFDVSHAPARDDAGHTAGVFAVCTEVTEQVVGARRLRLLRDLALRDDQTAAVERTCEAILDVVRGDPLDVPFAAVYLAEGPMLRRVAAVGVDGAGEPVGAALPPFVPADPADDGWAVRQAMAGAAVSAQGVSARVRVPAGPWGDLVEVALALPLPSADRTQPLGVLLAGVAPNRALDEAYRSFFALLAQQVSVAVGNARAYEEERRRAEALAEMDRVKTEFFTNVSHEFRTPLTLLLGPLEEALADDAEPLGGTQRERVDTARRNATRLLTLVNNLLSFASIEAGRSRRTAGPVDVAAATAEIASVFRAAVERAGLRLVVDCPPLDRPVALDAANWEKIVTNLLSNALKFTFVGEIRVCLTADDAGFRLSVADTGIGIPPTELAKLFERFHRVTGARSRSHEGTGIGLALVRELTRLEGGEVRVASEVGVGTTFTVEVPWSAPGAADAPEPDGRLAGAARAAAEEALRWLVPPVLDTAGARSATPAAGPGGSPPRILLADDNADMRAYLTRLLAAEGWLVEAVADGAAALAAVRDHPPDLLLTDVMMPGVDGFQLVRSLRGTDTAGDLPIIVLSARAGAEAGAEGLSVGADDYVVKPFAAPELLARVRTALARGRGRGGTRPPARVGTVAVITAGRALADAVRTLTDMARRALGADQAITALHVAGGTPLVVAVPDAVPGAAEVAATALAGPDGRDVGAIRVLARDAAAPTGAALALLVPVAGMVAALARSSWQPEQAQHVAGVLRRGVPPGPVPDVAGWDVAARQASPAAAREACEAWYDVTPLPGARLAISVGEVDGPGVAGVGAMGLIREFVRQYALAGEAPAGVVARAGELAGRLGVGPPRLFVGYVDLDGAALDWCAAGQPPPVHCPPGGRPGWLAESAGPPPRSGRLAVAPGAALVVCTDGLRAVPGDDADVPDRAAGAVAGGVRELVDAVLAGHGKAGAGAAVLAVRRAPAPTAEVPVAGSQDSWSYPATPQAPAAMRRDMRAALHRAGIPDDTAADMLLAVSEAVNNAVEHAQRPNRPQVDIGLRIAAGVAEVTVRDYGTWRVRQPAMDRGRGAALMNAYGDVSVVATAEGTTVTLRRRLS